MEKVHVSASIEFVNSSIHNDLLFTDTWSFKIEKFHFKKVSDKELIVDFDFEANLKISEDGREIREIPSEPTEEFQEVEQELETVLDLIAFQTNIALRVRSGSYKMTALGGGVTPYYTKTPVKDINLNLLTDQYSHIFLDKSQNIKLIAALRQHHRSLWSDELSEKIQKLYSILELLSTKGAGGSVFTKEELNQIQEFITEELGKNKEVSLLIRNQLGRLKAKSDNMAMIENIKLITAEGEMPKKEIKAILDKFRSTRAIPSHGSILPRRSEDLEDLLWDLETIAKDEIDSTITPRSHNYLVFLEKDVNKDFFTRNKNILSNLRDGYFAYFLRYDEVKFFSEDYKHWLLNKEGVAFLVSYSHVKKLTTENKEEVGLEDLEEPLKSLIHTIQTKLSASDS